MKEINQPPFVLHMELIVRFLTWMGSDDTVVYVLSDLA